MLVDLIRREQWPKGRISTAPLTTVAPFMANFDLTFHHTADQMAGDLGALVKFCSDARMSDELKLRRGGKHPEAIELPWLDVERALCIGGGADYGDELWLVLDYRANPDEPRVVANIFQGGRCDWREVTSSFSEFCRISGVTDGTWESAEIAPLSQEILRQLRSIKRSKWPSLSIYIEPPGLLRASEITGHVVMSFCGNEVQLKSGDVIENPCVLKIGGASKLTFARDDEWAGDINAPDNGYWIEVRPGRFPLTVGGIDVEEPGS